MVLFFSSFNRIFLFFQYNIYRGGLIIIAGYQNEFAFIEQVNQKHFYELNPLLQELLEALFPNISSNDIIRAYKYGRYAKADIVFVVKGIKKGISIKSGSRNSVHLEPIPSFIHFLKKNGFGKVDFLLRYLYSDGTNNNTGVNRQSIQEYKTEHSEEIFSINQEFLPFKKKIIERFLLQVDIFYRVSVDAFIDGTPNDFLWATRDEVVQHLVHTDCDSLSVHVGKLYIQEWNKNLNRNPKYEFCRNYIQVKWYSIFDDIIQIMCKR